MSERLSDTELSQYEIYADDYGRRERWMAAEIRERRAADLTADELGAVAEWRSRNLPSAIPRDESERLRNAFCAAIDKVLIVTRPWHCPAESYECAIRRQCTNKCGRKDVAK